MNAVAIDLANRLCAMQSRYRRRQHSFTPEMEHPSGQKIVACRKHTPLICIALLATAR